MENNRHFRAARSGEAADRDYRTQTHWLRSRRAAYAQGVTGEGGEGATKRRKLPFISGLRPLLASWLSPARQYNEDECFFPFPKLSFVIGPPPELLCQLCQVSRLTFDRRGEELDDTTFTIMPCGHAFGSQCLGRWLDRQSTCPSCRLRLVYPVCGHLIKPRPLTRDTIHMVPATVPDEGYIPKLCPRCRNAQLKEEAHLRLNVAIHEFREAKKRYVATNELLDGRALLRHKAEIDNVMRDEYHVKCFSDNLSNW